jgi:hypothetical protein
MLSPLFAGDSAEVARHHVSSDRLAFWLWHDATGSVAYFIEND